MKNIIKIIALSLFSTVSMAADPEGESDKQSFQMKVATQNDGDIAFYGDDTQFLITSVLTQKVLASEKSIDRIKDIDLSGMNLTGDFPREIGLLPNLKELNISDNALTGVDASLFDTLGHYRRDIVLSIYDNPIKTFVGPKDENVLVRLNYGGTVSVHFDATVFENGDFSHLTDLLKKNILSNETEQLTALMNIRISFYQNIPIPKTLTEQFGITHDGHKMFGGKGTTTITRQWWDHKCDIDVEYLAKRFE